ncbi:DUF4286 family protein [Marilutibacter chinensis]|uniref:DUF4286 family protein n=1 Tax=Marilutibacter chinensis TaxID=2912247 RepID=A0ABS9HTF5_9GAMM|nr:DUF4286 family protein [Lysobacter chinensis]MCF7221583.1 DUF4286 family protein [Lysobacter chinensis]
MTGDRGAPDGDNSPAPRPATVVYEVNLDVEAGVIDAYLVWLQAHVAEIRALPGFTGAEVFEVVDPVASAGRVALCVQYRLQDATALERYLRDHAPRLRADGETRFGGRFNASRRVLASLACGGHDRRHSASEPVP